MTGCAALVCTAATLFVPVPTSAAVEHFEAKVRPVLLNRCGECHGADPKKVKGGLDLTTRAGLFGGGDTGPVIAPGKPDESALIRAIRYADEDLQMPPKGKLPAAEVAALERWVRDGAVWPGATAPPKQTGGPLFTPEQKAYWAFQPVRDPAPPVVADRDWVRNPIDAFILEKLEAKGLRPAPPADRRTLLRRLTFALTGLPPTPNEIDAFEQSSIINHQSSISDAVDRLLASPHYGERWGRHWLDVARYADSNGFDEDVAYLHAWRYRDYVIRAFNADKPFDQFVQEQIAGDLLPPTHDPAVAADRATALGYLAVGPKLLAEPDKQKMLLDIADEQLDAVGRGLMGLTFGCARCHDHKFDPLPTRDYYSLLAVFTSTRTMQSLKTTAKVFERPAAKPDPPGGADARFRQADVQAEIKTLESQIPTDDNPARKKRRQDRLTKLKTELATLELQAPPADLIHAVTEGETTPAYDTKPRNLYVQHRGDYAKPGDEAPAIFPRIIAGEHQTPFVATEPNPDDKATPNTTRFGAVRDRSGRLELARWLTDPQHPLTARVFVNRVWLWHFGEGLVRTPDNFGTQGERPTHPELLDWLTTRFIESGWSGKALHRLILSSNTYQQSSAANERAAVVDPDNRLLWRYPRRRLEAESLRDAMLAVSGSLDRTVGGSLWGTPNFGYAAGNQSLRRTVYLPIDRNQLPPFLTAFDFPDPTNPVGKRAATVVAPQALFLMNNPFVAAQAAAFAKRVMATGTDVAARTEAVYRLALGRRPTAAEVARVGDYVWLAGDDEAAAWAGVCHAVFAGNEFAYLD